MDSTTCSGCKKSTDKEVIFCDSCNLWYCDNCHNLTKIILEALNKYQDKGLKWNCNHCDNSMKATHIKLEKIQNTIDNVLNNIDNNIKVINSKMDNYSPEKNIQSFAEIVKNLPNNSGNIASTIKTALSRQSVVLAKSDEKELNHIIHGISDE